MTKVNLFAYSIICILLGFFVAQLVLTSSKPINPLELSSYDIKDLDFSKLCKPEVYKTCDAFKENNPKRLRCALQQSENKLDGCYLKLQSFEKLNAFCFAELTQHCANIEFRGNNFTRCLAEHSSELSVSCKNFLKQNRLLNLI